MGNSSSPIKQETKTQIPLVQNQQVQLINSTLSLLTLHLATGFENHANHALVTGKSLANTNQACCPGTVWWIFPGFSRLDVPRHPMPLAICRKAQPASKSHMDMECFWRMCGGLGVHSAKDGKRKSYNIILTNQYSSPQIINHHHHRHHHIMINHAAASCCKIPPTWFREHRIGHNVTTLCSTVSG